MAYIAAPSIPAVLLMNVRDAYRTHDICKSSTVMEENLHSTERDQVQYFPCIE